VPTFTCATCGNSFSLSQKTLDQYPGWTPKQCRDCRTGTRRPTRRASAREEDLPLDQVLAKYTEGPTDGVFTDGAADPNPGPGGWGAVWVRDGRVVHAEHGHDPHTTNNRMELTALIAAYGMLPEDEATTIWTDSNLSVNIVTKWAPGWAARGWTRKGGEIANLDLVQELYALAQRHPHVELRWIKAHAGSRWNEYADSLATAYRRDTL
jgi:ribonuclease HI